jgi:hypothetical protein
MTTAAFPLLRSLIIYSVCVPLALILGYLISTPYDFTSFTVVGLVLFLLLIPLLLRWHHVWLIATWNMSMVLFFLPGRPLVWLPLAWISLLISFVGYTLNRKHKFIVVPQLARPLIFFAIVTVVTAKFRGGFGLQAFGSDTFGGKRYLLLLTSIAGYFAITSHKIPPQRVPLYVGLYLLSAATIAIGELSVILGPTFYFLFLIFPIGSAGLQTLAGEPGGLRAGFGLRLSGLASAGSALYLLMLCRYGIQEVFTWRRLGRLCFFLFFLFVAMLGGFRSILILFLLTFTLLFYLEGLMRSSLMPIFLLLAILLGTAIVPIADRLPLSVQRSLSFLPLPIDPVVKAGAEASTEWRVQMWKHVLPEVPEYLLLGKGYSFSAKDLALVRIQGVGSTGTEGAELAGDYHNGPLSVLIPFGIPGTIALLWLLVAGGKVLRANYLYGDPAFHRINTFLLAYFLAKIIFFFGIFGSLYSDLPGFVGLLALSVSINDGMAKPMLAPQEPKIVINRFKLQPPTVRPAEA